MPGYVVGTAADAHNPGDRDTVLRLECRGWGGGHDGGPWGKPAESSPAGLYTQGPTKLSSFRASQHQHRPSWGLLLRPSFINFEFR